MNVFVHAYWNRDFYIRRKPLFSHYACKTLGPRDVYFKKRKRSKSSEIVVTTKRCQSSGNFVQMLLYKSIGKSAFSGNLKLLQDFLTTLTGICATVTISELSLELLNATSVACKILLGWWEKYGLSSDTKISIVMDGSKGDRVIYL